MPNLRPLRTVLFCSPCNRFRSSTVDHIANIPNESDRAMAKLERAVPHDMQRCAFVLLISSVSYDWFYAVSTMPGVALEARIGST
jgi:hypothetical protein